MKIALAIFLLFLAGLGGVQAQFEPDPARLMADLPPDREGPVPVRVSLFLLDVTNVNGAEERFTGALYLNLRWNDPRMAFDAAKFGARRALYTDSTAEDQLQAMWSPAITVTNQIGSADTEYKSLTIYENGDVEYESRISGEFSSPMNLRGFPFDTQILRTQLESFEWNSDQVKLVATDEDGHLHETLATRDWVLSRTGSALKANVSHERYATGDQYSRYTAKIVVDRQPWFYMWSVIFPLILVTLFGMTCFFWDEETLSERIAQTLTCLLTVTAQSFAVSGDLPKISYFTRIDYAFLLTYITLMIVTVESMMVYSIHERNEARAAKIESTCQWAVPLAYFVGMIIVFWPW